MLQVKKNQPLLYEAIEQVLAKGQPLQTHQVKEKKRGQEIEWKTKVYAVVPSEITEKWKGVQRLIVTQKSITKKAGTTLMHSFRITDLSELSAEKLYEGIRGHWGIENKLHWVRDVNFKQDKNNIVNENAAVNMAIFNTMAINYLRENIEDSIKYSQIIFGQNVKEKYNQIRT